jgi:hypothetical protein
MNNVRNNLGKIAFGCALLCSANALAEGVSITFKNSSKWEIHHLFLSTTKEKEWGPEQLGKDQVIGTGDTFTLTDIDPGKYDMKLVDEDEDECILTGVKLASDQAVEITDKDLIACQSETEEASEE